MESSYEIYAEQTEHTEQTDLLNKLNKLPHGSLFSLLSLFSNSPRARTREAHVTATTDSRGLTGIVWPGCAPAWG